MACPWTSRQPEGATAFLGALVGVFGGLLAILAGAFYNAELNRKRDDRLRRQERAVLAASLSAEIGTIKDMVGCAMVMRTNDVVDDQAVKALFEDIEQRPPIIYQSNAQRIGILNNAKLAGQIVGFYRSSQWIGIIIPRLTDSSDSVISEVVGNIETNTQLGQTILEELSKIEAGD